MKKLLKSKILYSLYLVKKGRQGEKKEKLGIDKKYGTESFNFSFLIKFVGFYFLRCFSPKVGCATVFFIKLIRSLPCQQLPINSPWKHSFTQCILMLKVVLFPSLENPILWVFFFRICVGF